MSYEYVDEKSCSKKQWLETCISTARKKVCIIMFTPEAAELQESKEALREINLNIQKWERELDCIRICTRERTIMQGKLYVSFAEGE